MRYRRAGDMRYRIGWLLHRLAITCMLTQRYRWAQLLARWGNRLVKNERREA